MENVKKKRGRPRIRPEIEEFKRKSQQFFEKCDAENIPYTITGYAYATAGYREKLWDMERDTPELRHTIKTAKERIAAQCEQRCIARGNAGDIFLLKNHGFRDVQAIEQTGEAGGPMVVTWRGPGDAKGKQDKLQADQPAKIRLVK